jgi:hypothetical protein
MRKPMPKGWNKTVADLFEEMRQGKRLIATEQEGEWALEYERSLLPPTTIFPRKGQTWEATADCDVDFEAFFTAPGGGPSGKFKLSRGERVAIAKLTNSEALSVHFLPLRYQQLESKVVAPHVRSNPRYSAYAFYAHTGYFNEHFQLVQDIV